MKRRWWLHRHCQVQTWPIHGRCTTLSRLITMLSGRDSRECSCPRSQSRGHSSSTALVSPKRTRLKTVVPFHQISASFKRREMLAPSGCKARRTRTRLRRVTSVTVISRSLSMCQSLREVSAMSSRWSRALNPHTSKTIKFKSRICWKILIQVSLGFHWNFEIRTCNSCSIWLVRIPPWASSKWTRHRFQLRYLCRCHSKSRTTQLSQERSLWLSKLPKHRT